jgi:hypothetical protein
MKATVIASIVSLIAGGYIGYKIANDDLQEYIQASLKAYNETEQLNKEAMQELEKEKDNIISNLIVSLDAMRDYQSAIRDSANRVYNDTRSSNNRDTETDDSCGTLRETLRERSELLGRCSKLLERGTEERTEEALKHDALVDIVKSYQAKQ